MRVSKEFAEEFSYLVEWYGWTSDEVAEIKRNIKADPEPMIQFFSSLAKAHKQGYRFADDGGFHLLNVFCAEKGIPDPYGHEYTGAEVDRIASGNA